MYTAQVINSGTASSDISGVTFYRLALLLNGRPVRYIFGSGCHLESFAKLEAEAVERNHSAAVFATL